MIPPRVEIAPNDELGLRRRMAPAIGSALFAAGGATIDYLVGTGDTVVDGGLYGAAAYSGLHALRHAEKIVGYARDRWTPQIFITAIANARTTWIGERR